MRTNGLLAAMLLAAACGKASAPAETEAPARPAAEAPAPAAATPAPAKTAEPTAPTLLAVGTEAPDFTARDHNGNTIELAALRGKPVVLYWYPKDETPG